ncbi:MAG: hypothetical protein MI924_25310 [Chloroflexales bacterium]|nr:hypothetical protein [Chloroflexales bacterium]
MLGFDAQQRVNEALRRLDQALENDFEIENAVQQQAQNFRETFFTAIQYLERESLQLKALLVQPKRLDANHLQVQAKGRPAFVLALDTELAYDRKGQPAAQGQPPESAAQSTIELAARMFIVLTPPAQGLLRYYTIFGDGTWRRTVFGMGQGGIQAQSVLLQRFSPDVLVMEAIDLIGHSCTLHPTWLGMTQAVESLTTESLRERTKVKTNLTGIGVNRPSL